MNEAEHVSPTIWLTKKNLNELLTYQSTLPTGTTKGKRWKRRCGDHWFVGEYGEPYPDPRGGRFPELVPITWYKVDLVD